MEGIDQRTAPLSKKDVGYTVDVDDRTEFVVAAGDGLILDRAMFGYGLTGPASTRG